MTTTRMQAVRAAMRDHNVDLLLLSFGFDLPWLSGYHAMPLERLTMLVVPAQADATLVVPALEAPRVEAREYFGIRPWTDGEDPLDIVASIAGAPARTAISDQSWAAHLAGLQQRLGDTTWTMSSPLLSPLREVKSPDEIDAIAAAGAAADRVADQLFAGDIPLVGRREIEVSEDITARLKAEGHQSVDFAIVGSGPNAASPHHEPGERVINAGETVVCDFGGTRNNYCSDTTRTVFAGYAPDEAAKVYEVVRRAQQAGFEAATVGTPACDVDAAARRVIDEAGYGDYFIHRLGHGIGVETHEGPYLVSTNDRPLVAGNAFSIEPGIYLPGHFGVRIEDIVVATDAGPVRMNNSDRSLHVVD